jgi:hypothetical protein
VRRVSQFGPQNRQHRFGDLGFKITATVSFLGLKTKQASVCRLRHKTNGGKSARDTRRDLAACFVWKQVWLGFFSLASRLVEARRQVMYVVHCGGCVEHKLKTDESMRRATSDPATLALLFSLY